MKLKDLPQPIRELAEKRIREQGNEPNWALSLSASTPVEGFEWPKTCEGYKFWDEIDNGDFNQFYERYPNTLDQSEEPNPHYKATSIEPIEVIDAWDLDFYLGNVIKYIGRAKHKGSELSDLEKAADYLRMKIEKMKQK